MSPVFRRREHFAIFRQIVELSPSFCYAQYIDNESVVFSGGGDCYRLILNILRYNRFVDAGEHFIAEP